MKARDALYFDSTHVISQILYLLISANRTEFKTANSPAIWAEVKDRGRPKIYEYSETAGLSVKEKQQPATCKLIQKTCVLRRSIHPALITCTRLTSDKEIRWLANLLMFN